MDNNFVLIGVVSSVDEESGLVRVALPDMDNVVSPPLSLLTSGPGWALKNPIPEVGHSVVCLFPRSDLSNGICLGSLFDGSYSIPGEPLQEQGMYFEDGSYAYYDKTDGSININAEGSLNIDAAIVNITANTVNINSDSVILNAPIVNFNSINVTFSNNITVVGQILDGAS